MIEPTDEMVEAYARAFNTARATPRREGHAELDGLTAVLAIVERDYFVDERIPARCLAKSGTFHCVLISGHGDVHTASLGAGLGWSWS